MSPEIRTASGQPVPVWGTHDPKTLEQLADVASRAERAALMADGHLGYVMPIGGVAAYRDRVSVVGVGFDIACGNAAIKTDRRLTDIAPQTLADDIQRTVSFGVGRANHADDAPIGHPLFDDPAWEIVPKGLHDKARSQLGTVGSGNHYVDIFEDEDGWLWVGIHFGSRGFGHTVASGFLALSQGKAWGEKAPEVEVLLNLAQPIGHDYWHLMTLAGEYAYAGREWVARTVVGLMGGTEVELVHNHHNFAWKESHGGEELVVVRKGATPAFPGQLGFVGGSMGDDAVILRGAPETPDAVAALFSTVHGAGRVMGRMEAKKGRCTRDEKGKVIARDEASKITRQMMSEWTKAKGVTVRGGDVDESPHVYRRLDEVLTAQGATVEILHRLRPVIVVMAGNEYDPYKD